jgi:nitrogen fixation protein NifU and related proteins
MSSIYDELLMDHIRNARNYRVPASVSRELTGANVLCGDELRLYLDVRNGRIVDIAFQCDGCGICMASASMMTDIVMGRQSEDAAALLRDFIDVLGAPRPKTRGSIGPEQQALFDVARKSPARARCAALPWTTLQTGLDSTDAHS